MYSASVKLNQPNTRQNTKTKMRAGKILFYTSYIKGINAEVFGVKIFKQYRAN